MPTHDSHRDTPRARNIPELSTSTRITSVQKTSVQHAKPARRTHRRLLTPPLAQKNGIDPIQLVLPHPEELPEELAPADAPPLRLPTTSSRASTRTTRRLFTPASKPARCAWMTARC